MVKSSALKHYAEKVEGGMHTKLSVQVQVLPHALLERIRMAREYTGNVSPRKGLRVRVPCAPL